MENTSEATITRSVRAAVLKTAFITSLVTSVLVSALVVAVDTARAPNTPAGQSVAVSGAEYGASMRDRDAAVTSLVGQANKAVVSVVITKDVPVYERFYERFEPWGGGFGFSIPRVRQRGTEEQQVGGGSGFFVSAEGLVVTNRHVVSDEEASYTVILSDGSKHEAEVLARDPQLDVAVLRVSGAVPEGGFPYVEFGDSDTLQLGQTVVAIGNALAEYSNSVSVGVVSGLSRDIVAGGIGVPAEPLEGLIQTDAAINPGNSGGPLLDLNGKVIGINVAVAGDAQGIGFALPSNAVRASVESVKSTGRIERAYIGVRYVQVTPELQGAEGLPVGYGALVRSGEDGPAVVPGSPAQKAGLRGGDLIVGIDGASLETTSLGAELRKRKVGDTVQLEFYRGDDKRTVEVKLEKLPE